jgi:hypothetical protein
MITTILLISLSLGLVLLIASKFVNFETLLTSAVAKLRAWSARLEMSGQLGAIELGRVVDGLVMVIVAMALIYAMIPNMEEQSSTANITNETTKSFSTLAGWIVPVIMVIGIIYFAIKYFLPKMGKNKG